VANVPSGLSLTPPKKLKKHQWGGPWSPTGQSDEEKPAPYLELNSTSPVRDIAIFSKSVVLGTNMRPYLYSESTSVTNF
jgi:hypothetical protein